MFFEMQIYTLKCEMLCPCVKVLIHWSEELLGVLYFIFCIEVSSGFCLKTSRVLPTNITLPSDVSNIKYLNEISPLF